MALGTQGAEELEVLERDAAEPTGPLLHRLLLVGAERGEQGGLVAGGAGLGLCPGKAACGGGACRWLIGALDAALQAEGLHAKAAHGPWTSALCASHAHSRRVSMMDAGGSMQSPGKKRCLGRLLP
ncbi:unnamed protein product [Miscanthus lutarioriparius]|uniref:Uncharacterized protein n=1 Tax=Miscanthus lutarioriparius TaxID=422564 RepID=A0A811MVR3_9POAL|nr:unnamed protein product [Miscanthus lutarioriparius]